MWRWLALGSFLVFVVAITGVIVSSRQAIEISNQQTDAKNNREKGDQKGDKTFWDNWFPDPISLYTLALTVFTAVLAFGGLYQFQFLSRAERIAASSAQAAKDSADAAKKSAESYNSSQRAFVVPEGLKWFPTTEKSGKVTWHFYATWRNSGNTPTRNLRAYIVKAFSIGIVDINDPLGPQFGMTEEQTKLAVPNFLGPKAAMDSGPVSIDADDLLRVQQNAVPFVIGGVATYESVFPEDRPHITKSSWQIVTVIGNPKSGEEGIHIGTRTTRTNNCADEECL
jgi:hypothetical protein